MTSEWPSPKRTGPFNGEAVVLWRLCREERTLTCFVVEWPEAFWLGVECSAGELQASETLPGLTDVIAHADSLKAQFSADGWLETDKG